MEEEIEDIVGDVKLTDSQKSVATSNVYSMDFTDSSSDKNHSSGKETYVIEQFDSDDSDSYVPVHRDESVIDLDAIRKNIDANVQCDPGNKISRAASTSVQNCSIVAQETFTQTSKTIFELARTNANQETLETQTSFISIQENHTFEYRIEVSNRNSNGYATVVTNASEEQSTKYHASSSETVKSDGSDRSSKDVVHILDTDSKENILTDDTQNDTQYENMSDFDESNDSDIEQDSLVETKSPSYDSETEEARKIADLEIADLYSKIAENREGTKCYRPLTPLTEESAKKESVTDVESEIKKIENLNENVDKNILFTNLTGGLVKMLPKEEEGNEFKLPPIRNRSCPNSPYLDFLFTVQPSYKLDKAGTLLCLSEDTESQNPDRWEIKNKTLASGESVFISSLSESTKDNDSVYLPPIHIEGYVVNSKINKMMQESAAIPIYKPLESECDDISIKERIKELKIPRCGKMRSPTRSESRSETPISEASREDKTCDATERGCDALCVELLRRMRSSSWFEISDTMADIPKVLDKFWNVIAENRIVDLIRQVSLQVDSPRTQVARAGCNTLACILKKTKYTKKPDFNEAIALLLTKTGSFSRPVRRAANVALDGVVCGVDLSHAVTALCVHGTEHKSPLVRCAAARLLVVSCALCGGGRGLLRARPPSAAVARRHALRSLSLLLDDKSTDTRKYAERLYAMLRPLANFEAYYLTDVDVDLAARQMKKYDRLLVFPKDGR